MDYAVPMLVGLFVALFVLESRWPAAALPKVRGWWLRVLSLNIAQILAVVLVGLAWERWLKGVSLFRLHSWMGDVPSAGIAYLISCILYYWWHRFRHESALFWRLCHQLHHSPRRIELLTSFYKHPIESAANALLSSSVIYLLLGCSLRAAALYTFVIAGLDYFAHANLRTPRWLGFLVQRPESHRVHHEYARHSKNYADLPVIDWLFGTFENPLRMVRRCGFSPRKETRVPEMLFFKDVHDPTNIPGPTCFGCRKRWLCYSAQSQARQNRSGLMVGASGS